MTITNPQFVLTVTGGGSQIIGDLLSQGGASSWFLEANVPYATKALVEFLDGYEPEKYASDKTARLMAIQSYKRAIELGATPEQAVGVSCTASLKRITDEREGRVHRAYIGIQTKDRTQCFGYSFIEPRSRAEEEILVGSLIGNEIDRIRSKLDSYPILLTKDEEMEAVEEIREDRYNAFPLLFGSKKRDYKLVGSNEPFLGKGSVIFPGSFNPLHDGHAAIVKAAHAKLGKKVYLEISVTNPDKPSLDYTDIERRIFHILEYRDDEFHNALAGIILSNTAKFYDKIWQYPTSTYLVGTDTVNRIFDPKYGNIHDLIDLIKDTDSHFLIADRAGYKLDVHPDYKFSAWYIENRFNRLEVTTPDISSTQIRRSHESS